MSATGKSKTAVWRWQEHFMREGVGGLLHNKTRPPGTVPIEAVVVSRIIELTRAPPPNEVTHWTLRAMAKVEGVAASTVHQIWRAHGLAPATLFAAINMLNGTVLGKNMQRHRHQKFIRFLNKIERTIPAGKAIHAIVDNYATHKHVTDDWSCYGSLRTRGYDHHAIAECGDPEVAEVFMPIIHLIFNNMKNWLNGIHHGVSSKHLQAYLNEFTFRFNRRLYPFNAFRSLLGIAGGAEPPT